MGTELINANRRTNGRTYRDTDEYDEPSRRSSRLGDLANKKRTHTLQLFCKLFQESSIYCYDLLK